MLSYDLLSQVIAHLKAVLMYRIDDPVAQRNRLTPNLDEELFFRVLYEPLPRLENRCMELLRNYVFPVVLSGKQGLGKTSVLEKVLRSIEEDRNSTLIVIRMRCNWSDRTYFENLEGVIEFFRIALRSQMAKLRQSFFDVLASTYEDEAKVRFIEESGDPAVKLFRSRLFEIYDLLPPDKRQMWEFPEWVVWSLKQRDPEVCREAEKLRDDAALYTQVTLLALSYGPQYRILFSVDNVENLLDLAFIRNAFALLMRSQNELGEHGRLVLATRPASHEPTTIHGDRRRGDEGRNLYDPIDFNEFLDPVVVSPDEIILTESHGHIEMSAAVSRYIRLLKRRIDMLLEELPAEEEIRAVFSSIEAFFVRGRECTHSIAGLSNHSCRTVLLCVVNFLEQTLRDTEFMESVFGVSIKHDADPSAMPGMAPTKHIKEPSPSAALLNAFLFGAGNKGAEIPGLKLHRLDFSNVLEKYRTTNGRIPHEALSTFYILKTLNGCDIASFDDEEHGGTNIRQMSVNDLVMTLAPFGFDRDMIYQKCTVLCQPDMWDQTVLAYTTPDKNAKWREASGKDVVELEARGWMIANYLPFRLHYWRGDLARSNQERGVWLPHGFTSEQMFLVLRAVADWAEIEFRLVGEASRVLGNRSSVLSAYREITHFRGQTTWVFQAILLSFLGHVRNLRGRIQEKTPESEDLAVLAVCEETTNELANALMDVAHRVGGNELPNRWAISRQPELADLADRLWGRR